MTDLDSAHIKLLNCDCMEYMRSLPDNAFQLAVCDPPYGINIGNGLGNGRKGYKTHKSWQMCSPGREYFDELRRVSRNQIIWGGNYFTDVLPPCDRILDTHLGSGSSAIAAYDLGFDFVGTEIDRSYYDATVKRVSEYAAQKRLEI